MRVKRQDVGKARDFWTGKEELLRGYLESGMTLRQAAEAIGATYSATKSKSRRLVAQKSDAEAASASEWVLAGYEGEEALRLSGGQEIAPREVLIDRKLTERERKVLKRSTRLVATGEAAPHPDLEKLPKLRKPAKTEGYRGFESKAAYEAHYSDERNYASEIPAMEAYAKGDAVYAEYIAADSPGEEGGIDTDQIPPKRKRTARPKPPKLVLSEPAVDSGSKAIFHAQLEASAPPKRTWDFPAPGGCLFPHGDVGRPGFRFCGETVMATGAPYCQKHVQLVYGHKRVGAGEEV